MSRTRTQKHLRERRSAIVKELSRMSRNSWRDARSSDYWPLEAELRRIEPLIERRVR